MRSDNVLGHGVRSTTLRLVIAAKGFGITASFISTTEIPKGSPYPEAASATHLRMTDGSAAWASKSVRQRNPVPLIFSTRA